MFIRSKSRFSDTLIIGTGTEKKKVTVDIDLIHSARRIRKARETVAEAQQQALKDQSPAAVQQYGQALRSLVAAVFGDKQADELVSFYEGHYDSMLNDIMPYIFKRVVPAIQRASKAHARQYRKGTHRAAE